MNVAKKELLTKCFFGDLKMFDSIRTPDGKGMLDQLLPKFLLAETNIWTPKTATSHTKHKSTRNALHNAVLKYHD